MMEIAYGPLILDCAMKSVAFAVLFALIFPTIEARVAGRTIATGPARSIGLGIVALGMFGLAHLAIVCAADGFPPRIIQSTALAFILAAAVGFAFLARNSAQPRLA